MKQKKFLNRPEFQLFFLSKKVAFALMLEPADLKREKSDCRAAVLSMVQSVSHRPTPHEIEQHLANAFSRNTIRSSLRYLVEEGVLAYVSIYGRQVIEPSMDRIVRISPHISLAPENRSPCPEGITVFLRHGSAFGTGQHPTTRLALNRLDDLVFGHTHAEPHRIGRVLDIGTGSGVLAIAALKLGALSATGLDIDPCSLFEATENAAINGVAERITIANQPLESLGTTYDLILANLRTPTLYAILPDLKRLCALEGYLVLSGIQTEELDPLVSQYASQSFQPLGEQHEDGWSAVSLRYLLSG